MIKGFKLYSILLVLLFFAPPLSFAEELYWEAPTQLSKKDGRFLQSASYKNTVALVWQETLAKTKKNGVFFLSTAIHNGSAWQVKERISKAIPYAGTVPSVASITIGKNSTIMIVAVTGQNELTVFSSSNLGASFQEKKLNIALTDIVAPYICNNADGGYYLFISQGKDEKFLLFEASSKDGLTWSDFKPFAPAQGLSRRVFLPTHAIIADTDVIVFQAHNYKNNSASYQLFSTVKKAQTNTWTTPIMLTPSENQHNQRPVLSPFINSADSTKQTAELVWEYTNKNNKNGNINYARLDEKGKIIGSIETIANKRGQAFSPSITHLNNSTHVIWTQKTIDHHILFFAHKDINTKKWLTEKFETGAAAVNFVKIVRINKHLEIIWENATRTHRIVYTSPDKSVAPVKLSQHQSSKKAQKKITIKLALPLDSSGIAGYSYVWAKDSQPIEIPKKISHFPDETIISFLPPEDGNWYLGVRCTDYAGNWSEPNYILCNYDTTPPSAPTNIKILFAEGSFLPANTFSVSWNEPKTDITGKIENKISGFTWTLQYLDSLTAIKKKAQKYDVDLNNQEALSKFCEKTYRIKKPPALLRTIPAHTNYTNLDNGLYALSIAAIDENGNIGDTQQIFFRLNKFIPYTIVRHLETHKRDSGEIDLNLYGRGFQTDGKISAIYLDKDGEKPYDYIIKQKDIRIINDRKLQFSVNEANEGFYRLLLQHKKRGLYSVPYKISISEIGTVKLGIYTQNTADTIWSVTQIKDNKKHFHLLFVLFIIIFTVIPCILALFAIIKTTKETISIKKDVQALFTGATMSNEKKKIIFAAKHKGISLRIKLMLFTIILIGSVIASLTIPLGMQFRKTQEQLLVQSLKARTEVLLESLVSGAHAYLPGKNILELSILPKQARSFSEAKDIVITGPHFNNSKTGTNFLWAANRHYLEKEFASSTFSYGRSEYLFENKEQIEQTLHDLNNTATKEIDIISQDISILTKEALTFALKSDKKSLERLQDIQSIIKKMEEKINLTLNDLANKAIGTYPIYNTKELSRTVTNFLFYKPIMYRKTGVTGQYVHGMVAIQISTEPLIKQIDQLTKNLYYTIISIALLVLAVGIVGAWILSSIIISPINKLAEHVAMIRNTEDKEQLDGKMLVIKSKDEIGMLGETINDMTSGLVQAASASKDLTVGKEIQKMFIPLETNIRGKKLTSGYSKNDHAEFFGYYEGARGVSGDYFDYIQLDDRHYAIIKCDVAGKGVPAALIMVEVATLFLNYFNDWSFTTKGVNIAPLVIHINNLIESRGFQGRFAAFTICIFNSLTGELHICNAGDNILHIYEGASKKIKTLRLQESAAAGVFSGDLIEMKGGFKVEKIMLQAGDVLLLYTDGIEEAKRLFRDNKLNPILCNETGLEQDAPHESHNVGQDGEELGYPRLQAITEAVFARQSYTLKKSHTPKDQAYFHFDFSNCNGTLEESVLALIAVERVFRMYADPSADLFDRIQVDKKIDRFLNKHFKEYGSYCANRQPHPKDDEYLLYTHLKEDPQYDDLTLLSIKKI